MMRSFVWLPLLCLCLVSPASSALLLYEGFDYNPGDQLNTKINPSSGNTWQKPTTPAGSSATALVTAGSLNYSGLASSSGNSFGLPRTTQSNISKITVPGGPYNHTTASTSVFFSFAMQLTDWVTLTDTVAASATHRDGDFLAGFTAAAGTNAMSAANVYAGQVRIRRELDGSGVQTGRYELGFHKNNHGGAGNWAPTWDTSQSFAVGDSVFVVGEYQFGTSAINDDTVRLWINPTPGEPAAAPSVVSTFGNDVHVNPGLNAVQGSINSFWFRDGNTFLPGPAIVDELRIGTTYESVTPAIPEPSTLLLAGLAIAAAGFRRVQCRLAIQS